MATRAMERAQLPDMPAAGSGLRLLVDRPSSAGPARNSQHPTPPLGLYVHIPFCVRKCHYCDFNAGPAAEAVREAYVAALCREIAGSPQRGEEARTVFFGGGTPSELSTPQLASIAGALWEAF